jgi:hypothetical protein
METIRNTHFNIFNQPRRAKDRTKVSIFKNSTQSKKSSKRKWQNGKRKDSSVMVNTWGKKMGVWRISKKNSCCSQS